MASKLKRLRVGIIGLGPMAHALAQRLAASGFEVLGYDLDPATRANFTKVGARAVEASWGAVDAVPYVILCLSDRHVMDRVLTEIAPALSPGHILINLTPGDPDDAKKTERKLGESGVICLEAAVASRVDQVLHAQTVMLVGGDYEAFESCRHIWNGLGGQTFLLGPAGCAAKMKMVTQMMLGLNRAVLAEGLSFARHLCLDPAQTLEVLRTSTAYSRVMDTKGEKMLQGDFRAQRSQTINDQLAEVVRTLDAARHARIKLTLTDANRALLDRAERKGCGLMDNSAVICAYDPEAK